ncbi:MAG: hypothetical protein AB1643_01095 [Patescibacteria group bacterium]
MKKSKGVSLIEGIIYMAIFIVISVAVINSLIIVLGSFGKAKLLSAIDYSGEAAMERMIRETRMSYDVDSSFSVFGSNPGRLVLKKYISGGATTTVDFYINNGLLFVSEGGEAGETLIYSGVSVSNFTLNSISSSTTSKAIKISLELMANRGDYQRTERFYDTAILRDSY